MSTSTKELNTELGRVIAGFLQEKKLSFYVKAGVSYDHIYPIGSDRGRATVWGDIVSVYDLNPGRHYTAIGDIRCDLRPEDPTFLEQLEAHLLIDNAIEEVWSAT